MNRIEITRPLLASLACVNPECECHGKKEQDNLHIRTVYGRDQTRYLCWRGCGGEFSERKNTAVWNRKIPDAQAVSVAGHLVEGMAFKQLVELRSGGDRKIPVPVLSLHNLGDMFVPFHNEIAYAQDAADQGRSHMLVQRAIRGVSHCDMTPSELITGFTDLVQWVELGIKPAGDVILDPAAVAAPDYGCQFTDDPAGLHVLATPCP